MSGVKERKEIPLTRAGRVSCPRGVKGLRILQAAYIRRLSLQM